MTEKAGSERDAAERLRHGRRGRRLRQRRLRGPVRHQLRRQHALSQQRRRHVHRRHRRAPASRAERLERERRASSTTTTTASSICSSRATSTGRSRRTAIAARRSPATAPTVTPTTTTGVANILYHNNGDGTFTDVSAKAGIADATGKGLGVAFADYDRDGFMDIYVANDSVQSFLYRNNRRRHVHRGRPPRRASGSTRTARPSPAWAWTSPTTTTTASPTSSSRISRTSATGCFARTPTAASVTPRTRPVWAAPRCRFPAGARGFFDYDNDGWKDLFVAQGHVMDTIEKTSPNLTLPAAAAAAAQRVRAFRAGRRRATCSSRTGPAAARRSATWTTTATSTSWSATSARRPSCCGTTAATAATGWRSEPSARRSNRDGIGCRVKVVSASGLTQYFTVNTAVGYLSASDKRLLVGLGGDAVGQARRDPLAVRRRPDVRERRGRPDAGGDGARRGEPSRAVADDHAPRSCWRCSRRRGRPAPSRRASRRAASSRSRAASPPAARSPRASPTSPRRPA